MADLAALTDLETLEVSLVRRGANKKRFALRKEQRVSELINAALETECEGEEEVLKGLEGDTLEAARVAYRALKATELPEGTKLEIGKTLGLVIPPEEVEKLLKEEAEEEESAEPELSPEIAEKLETLQKQSEELTKALETERAERLRIELTKQVETSMSFAPGSTDEKVSLLEKAEKAGLRKELEGILKAASEQLGQSELFKARGAVAQGPSEAKEELEQRIVKLRGDNPGLTYEQAYVQVVKADPELRARVREERN